MTDKKVAVIGIPGKWSTEVLADALAEKSAMRLVVDMAEVTADLERGTLLANGHDLCRLDALVVKKISQSYSPDTLDRIELLRLAQNCGVRVFSAPEKIIRMIDRLACTMTLSNAGVAMPPTVITESLADAFDTVKRFGGAIFKPLYSTKARGMMVVENSWSDIQIMKHIESFQRHNPMMYIQKKLDLQGRDYGLVFLGGRYLGSYARVASDKAWNTTINSGGRYAAHKPGKAVIEMAETAQALFGMDFTTVDVAETASGPVVFEVSAFGGFRGAREGIGIDAAALYADYVLEQLA